MDSHLPSHPPLPTILAFKGRFLLPSNLSSNAVWHLLLRARQRPLLVMRFLTVSLFLRIGGTICQIALRKSPFISVCAGLRPLLVLGVPLQECMGLSFGLVSLAVRIVKTNCLIISFALFYGNSLVSTYPFKKRALLYSQGFAWSTQRPTSLNILLLFILFTIS